jgi:oligopeptide/dipeptide ABC transporter ATP-binding protein
MSDATNVVAVRELHAHYPLRRDLLGRPREWLRAVDGVSFEIRAGETLGLVGESGCGKSTLGRTLLALRPASSGEVDVLGQSVFGRDATALKALRRRMQIVFQDPYASLNPREQIGDAVRSGLDIHGIGTKAERRERVGAMLEQVGLHPSMAQRYPHEFSGGQRQRIGLARALVLEPSFLVCDEPVSALDVSVQAQILNLMKSLQQRLGLTCLFISHNLAVVEHMADRVAVMYYGRIVEIAPRAALFKAPRHPYTRSLLAAVPAPDPRQPSMRATLRGDPPDPAKLPQGCRFRSRCPLAVERCAQAEPALETVDTDHAVACWRHDAVE